MPARQPMRRRYSHRVTELLERLCKAVVRYVTQQQLVLEFLCRRYSHRVSELLERRREVQARYDAGQQPNFLPETKHVSCGGSDCCVSAHVFGMWFG